MKVLLDTDAYSQLMRGHRKVVDVVRRTERLFLSAIVAGELLHGFHWGSRFQRNLETLQTFLGSPYVDFVPVSFETADRFGRIAGGLRRKGTPIPTNDIWVAAHAMETGAQLLSFDGHFRHVDGLAWLNLED